jgi:hypothetical protein
LTTLPVPILIRLRTTSLPLATSTDRAAPRRNASATSWTNGSHAASSRDNLASRFRLLNDDAHHSAFFELFIHELVFTRGHRVVAVEPKLPHTDKTPDFLIEAAEGHRLYLECALATGRSAQGQAAQARLNRALKAIERTPSPAHYLSVVPSGDLSGEVSMKRLTRRLQKWVVGLPSGDRAMADPFVYEELGLTLIVRAFPRRTLDQIERTIGVTHFPAQTVKTGDDLRRKLKGKATKYGDLDHPHVVALNALGMFAYPHHAVDALFGSPRVAVSELPDGRVERHEERAGDGVWRGPKGAQNTRLSAVISTEGVDPWNLGSRRGRLIRNPWAAKPLPPFPLGIDEYTPEASIEGERMDVVFGLPGGWPGPPVRPLGPRQRRREQEARRSSLPRRTREA